MELDAIYLLFRLEQYSISLKYSRCLFVQNKKEQRETIVKKKK